MKTNYLSDNNNMKTVQNTQEKGRKEKFSIINLKLRMNNTYSTGSIQIMIII